MAPTLEDVNVEIARLAGLSERHSSEIDELKQLAHDTLMSMRDFSEKVTRLLTLHEAQHTPDTCPGIRAVRHDVETLQSHQHELSELNLKVVRLQDAMARHESEEQSHLKELGILTAERQRNEGKSSVLLWLLNGGAERVVTAGGILWLIVQSVTGGAAPTPGH